MPPGNINVIHDMIHGLFIGEAELLDMVNGMWYINLIRPILFLMAFVMFSSAGLAVQSFSGEVISIDLPVADDIIAGGDTVNINAPVDSAIVAGGSVNINAPVKGDVVVAGGQVDINSDVGGKVVAIGGNVRIDGNVGTNLVAAGGQVNVLPGNIINRDALIAGGQVINAGRVNGTLSVSASQFNNTGSASLVKFHKVEERNENSKDFESASYFFELLSILGYFILGLILVRYLPGLIRIVDSEVRRSTLVMVLLGFVMIIAAFIAILLVALTVVGLPIAMLSALLMIAAFMLSGTIVSFSLGNWISELAKIKQGDLVCFVIGNVVLNILTHLPMVGGLISVISMSLGFAALIYAARNLSSIGHQAKTA